MKANLGAAMAIVGLMVIGVLHFWHMAVVAESWCLGFFAKKISVDNGPQLPRDGD